MRLASLCIVSLIATSLTVRAAPAPSLTRPVLAPRDAAEVLQLLSSSELKGADVPEVYRLEALLSQIAQSPTPAPPQAHQQPEFGEPVSEREVEHRSK